MKQHFKPKNICFFLILTLLIHRAYGADYKSFESFEGGGWNATSPRGYTPGRIESLKPAFMFNQLQGPHSFVLESNIVRSGSYAAKLVWKHENFAQWNESPTIVDNTDRKAMFHGKKNKKVLHAESWYGWSIYFPSAGTKKDAMPWLFFQLHASADSDEVGRNPPFSLTLADNGITGSWKWDAQKTTPKESKGGQGGSSFSIPGAKSDYLDRWVDFVLHIRTDYTTAKTGFFEIWIDGKKVMEKRNIQLGYNDDKGIYPSWGMYWTGTAKNSFDHWLYLDETKIIEITSPSDTIDYQDLMPENNKKR